LLEVTGTMSICTVISTSNGIALASDSKVSNGGAAKKFLGLTIDKKKYAVSFVGCSNVNKRSVIEIFESIEKNFSLVNPSFEQIIGYFVTEIEKEFNNKFQGKHIEDAKCTNVEFILCGFENNEIAKPKVYQHIVNVEFGRVKNRLRTSNTGDNKFCAFGAGRKKDIKKNILIEGSRPQNLKDYEKMSKEQAINHAKELVDVMCKSVPDVCGPPIVGGFLTPVGLESPIT
jgi:hypothetical protein